MASERKMALYSLHLILSDIGVAQGCSLRALRVPFNMEGWFQQTLESAAVPVDEPPLSDSWNEVDWWSAEDVPQSVSQSSAAPKKLSRGYGRRNGQSTVWFELGRSWRMLEELTILQVKPETWASLLLYSSIEIFRN